MSNTYLKVTIEEKNKRSQNFDFLGLKNLPSCQFCGTPTHADITEFLSCCNLKIRDLGAKLCVFTVIFILKGIMTF